MIKLMTGGLILAALAACNNSTENAKEETPGIQAQHNPLTEQEKNEGWQLLFDGETTKGWHRYGGGQAGASWKVADGAIYFDTTVKKDDATAGGDITTDDEFENFDLKLEWKIAPGGNSGIIFYVHEDTTLYERPYETGPEMQVLDNDGHPDGQYEKHRAGDLYDLIKCSKETVKPVGEWNQAEIKCQDGRLELYLNGENVVSTMLWDENWKTLLANSKFKAWPGFGTFKKGRIDLQDHDNTVWYRNIRIRRL